MIEIDIKETKTVKKQLEIPLINMLLGDYDCIVGADIICLGVACEECLFLTKNYKIFREQYKKE